MSATKTSKRGLNDGKYILEYKPDGVYLSVYPPVARGNAVVFSEVIERLTKKNVTGYSGRTIEEIVKKASKMPEHIAPPQEEKKLNSEIRVDISGDKMKAFITLTEPDGGVMLTPDEILERMNDKGILFGINKEKINGLCENPTFDEEILIAEGQKAANGKNGEVIFNFNSNTERKPKVLEDGKVDFMELNLIQNVKQNQVLCTITEPVPGTPGINVLNQQVKALDGKAPKLPRGKNVKVNEEGDAIISVIDGSVELIDGKVNVYATYEVPDNVDASTGNVNFVGNVVVRGNVQTGFEITAGGNIEVWGVVEGATLRAEGDIILKRGIQGGGRGFLYSGNNIISRYVENSILTAAGNITAEAIMHSNVKCGNSVELVGSKGLIVGGSLKVSKEISAKVIGSSMSTTTDIEVGVNPALRERYKELKDNIKQMEEDMKKADQAVVLLKKLEKAAPLSPDKMAILNKSINTKEHFKIQIEDMKEELVSIDETLKEEVNGKIHVQSIMYPGTKVAIGTCLMYVREKLQYCTLYRDQADVRVGPYGK
jgi:uncharacterized protein (DUF342 family)